MAGRAIPAATRSHEVPWELRECAEERNLVTVEKTPVAEGRCAGDTDTDVCTPDVPHHSAHVLSPGCALTTHVDPHVDPAVLMCHVILLACSALGVPLPLTWTLTWTLPSRLPRAAQAPITHFSPGLLRRMRSEL